MANKKKVVTESSFLRAISYFALVIAAVVFLLGAIPALGAITGILNLVGQICLLIGIGIPAYNYTCGKKVAWRVIYWIALVVYLLGCVLGVIKLG